MQRNLSLYLHLVRFAAAIAVVLSHSAGLLHPFLTAKLSNHGSEAVAVFFVLSGFMMRYVTDNKERNAESYATARILRILSVAPLAIVLGILADVIGHHFNAIAYEHLGFFHPIVPSAILSSLTFTNELWFEHVVVGSNEAYWSLGFEVQYYVVFGLLLFLRGRTRIAAIALWSVIVGPKILLYLPLWLTGVFAYDTVARRPFFIAIIEARSALRCFSAASSPTSLSASSCTKTREVSSTRTACGRSSRPRFTSTWSPFCL